MPASASPSCTLATTRFTFSSSETTLASTRASKSGRKPGAVSSVRAAPRGCTCRPAPLGAEHELDAPRVPDPPAGGSAPGWPAAATTTRRLRAKTSARRLAASRARRRGHPALVGGGEHVGRGRPARSATRELLRAGEVEAHARSRDAGARSVAPSSRKASVSEAAANTVSSRVGAAACAAAGRGAVPSATRQPGPEAPHASIRTLFPIMISVDLITATTSSPTRGPAARPTPRVMTETSSWSPIRTAPPPSRLRSATATIRAAQLVARAEVAVRPRELEPAARAGPAGLIEVSPVEQPLAAHAPAGQPAARARAWTRLTLSRRSSSGLLSAEQLHGCLLDLP